MKDFWTVILRVTVAEFQSLLKNKGNLVMLVGTPLLFITLFGYMYSAHVVNGIRTVVLDQDNSSLSRSVTNAFENSDKFQIIGRVESKSELKAAVESGAADAALVIPPHFYRDIKKQHSSQVLVVINGSNMVIANSVVSAASEIVQTLSAGAGVKVLEGKGFLPGPAMKLASEISFRTRVWYNPTFNYTNFLLLGLVGTVIQQVMLLFTAIAVVEERNAGALDLLEKNFSRLAAYILGKLTPYFIINFASTNLVLAIVVFGFQVPFRGSLTALLILETVFISCVAALGIFLSTACRDQLQATQLAMLVAVPSFLLSGYTWPLQAMPVPLQIVSQMLPLTYFVNPLRKEAVMGVGLQVILKDIAILGVAAVLLIPLSIVVLRVKLRESTARGTMDSSVYC